jgi:uncharacterized protein
MRIILVAVALALTGAGSIAAAKSPTARAESRYVGLTIATATRRHAFRVEVARTEAEQQRGMMMRPKLAPFAGMIFPFAFPRTASFWMKDCPHPLDMVFIRADGTIARIVTAVPYSLTPVTSGEPVTAVLEIAGGRATQLGVRAGDKVVWDAH